MVMLLKRLEQRRRAARRKRLARSAAEQVALFAFLTALLGLAAFPSPLTPVYTILAAFLGVSALVAIGTAILGPFAGPML